MHGAVPQLHDYLSHSAGRLPNKVALVCAGGRYSFGELESRSNALANALVRRGVERGDRVVVFAENGVEAVLAFWAALKANAVAVLVNPLTKRDKLAYLLNDSQATALIADGDLASVFVDAVASAPNLETVLVGGEIPDTLLEALPGGERLAGALAGGPSEPPPARRGLEVDLAAIIYTSGSTGEPKGVMLTHRNMLSAASSIATYLRMVEDDVVLNALPLAFDYGLYQLILAARVGARLVLERSFAFPMGIVERMAEEGVTGFPGVPTVFAMLAELRSLKGAKLPRLRYVTNTAAALPPKHIALLKELFPEALIFSMYGLTECKRCSFLPPEDLERKPGSVGVAIPNTELWVVSEDDRRLGPNEVGQLVIRGPTVMRGYWGKPEATASKLRPGPLPGEQVLYTGDLCKLDEDGYLYFVGRMDDIIKSRGEKVAPKEVEAALVAIPGVKESAVIGVPDDRLGQAVKAYVVLEQGVALSPKAIQLECQKRLEPFMVPKQVVVVSELPKTSSGKIKKTELK
ncbi:MAG: class I adenylate-forming enzyme family protein [Deltaproteobacteria bacterium]